ncbi:hypothetical protein GQ53DRAFT_877792 [Thozetella sp. PMI_491]|nr:hypothetical protein GQ53DRAFT_877792 [Thozetella sp. PMI_491]
MYSLAPGLGPRQIIKFTAVLSGLLIGLVGLATAAREAGYGTGKLLKYGQPFQQATGDTQGDDAVFPSYNRYGIPIYNDDNLTRPPQTIHPNRSSWGADETVWASESEVKVWRTHPRLFGSSREWQTLVSLIPTDPYLSRWNKSIFDAADAAYSEPALSYVIDNSLETEGVLNTARALQLRIKYWAYAHRLSQDLKWKERIWKDLLVASGNATQYFGEPGDNWNTRHWLDVGEFLVAFALAYDWLYQSWTVAEREALLWTMISLGLEKGAEAYSANHWFLSVNGNWNCVTNGGLIIGSLAVYHEDPTGIANQILPMATENAEEHCGRAVHSDGTWTETPDYWYFGTQAHAQISSALLTATGSTHGMLSRAAFDRTSLFHMYSYGMTKKFEYGDCGPRKLTATANSLFFYGAYFNTPAYMLFQRDRIDAADPLSMLWYEPQITGSWFHDLPLDREFPDPKGAWVSMRSSWSDPNELFVAMKAGRLTGHQTHGNLDAGDFVLDALGERWAVQLCQDSYVAPGYFSSERQDSLRWEYYRCSTAGQNVLLYNGSNQVVDAEPSTLFQSTNTTHSSADFRAESSTAFWSADLSTAYAGDVDIRRSLRLLQGRKQVLIQDEIRNVNFPSQWRMHTEATITYSEGGRKAYLHLNNKTLDVTIGSLSRLHFHTMEAARGGGDSILLGGVTDLDNPGVNVLAIDIPPGNHTVTVRFTPHWTSSWVSWEPPVIPSSLWSLTSHNPI